MLIVAALAATAAVWLLLSMFYGEMDPLTWLPAMTVIALAVFEGVLAQNTRARIERRPGHPKVEPLAVARYVVLAKASSLLGAIYTGLSVGLLAWLLVNRTLLNPTEAAQGDIPEAAGGLVAALALIGAALWLERACRVPEGPEDDDAEDSGRP